MSSSYWLAEVLLALAALLVASQFWYIARDRYQSPALVLVAGLVLLALAALSGAYRYGIDPHTTALHRTLSQLSGYVTFLSAGVGLLWVRLRPSLGEVSHGPAYVALVLIIALALGTASSEALSPSAVGRLLSTLGLSLWLGVALVEFFSGRHLSRGLALLLLAGAGLILFAGLVVGSGATRVFGLARMNWFHLLLAAGILLLLCARPLFAVKGETDE